MLAIVREEAYYFTPQGQTKIMNEGWASYWHSTMMTTRLLDGSELVDYADHHSGTMATQPGRLNPYKLGIELLRDIEERWNKGQFGADYEACDDYEARRNCPLFQRSSISRSSSIPSLYGFNRPGWVAIVPEWWSA